MIGCGLRLRRPLRTPPRSARSEAGRGTATVLLLLFAVLLTPQPPAAAFLLRGDPALPPCSRRLTEAAQRVLTAYRREGERNRQRDVLPEDLQNPMTRFVDWLNGLGMDFKLEQRRRELIDAVRQRRGCLLTLP
jgi:hypothetical protein